METKQESCEERIQSHLDGWLGDMRKFNKVYEKANQLNAGDAIDQLQTQLHEEPIGYSKATVHRIEYSWGGPQDYFEVWEDDGQITRISYHFLDWFDGATRWLEGEDFEVACEYLAPLVGLYA